MHFPTLDLVASQSRQVSSLKTYGFPEFKISLTHLYNRNGCDTKMESSLRRLLFGCCELLPLPAEGYVALGYYGMEILRVDE
jgi:hypothetical protein